MHTKTQRSFGRRDRTEFRDNGKRDSTFFGLFRISGLGAELVTAIHLEAEGIASPVTRVF